MYFYLKEPKSEKETSILIQYSGIVEKGNFKYYTGLKIHPKDWDFKNRLPVTRKGIAGAKLKQIKAKITPYNNLLEKIVNYCDLNNIAVTRELLKKDFDQEFKKKKQKNTIEYLSDFIDEFTKKAPKLINRSTKRYYAASKIKHYVKVGNRIKDFEAYRKKRIKLNSLDISVYDELLSYLLDKKCYSVNYSGDIIKNLKKFLKVADVEFKLNVHHDYKTSDFSVIKEESVSIALNENEIDSMFEYDFSYDKDLENCRDLAIIGMWTGLRISDFMNLSEINPNDRFITVQPQKTKDSSGIKVVIPLHHQIKEVIGKRGMPKVISDSDFNESIKIVCKRIGLTDLVKGSLMVKDEKLDSYRKKVGMYPKYKLVSSHTCRRSFATNQYKMNFPTLSIMNITGHKTERSFLSYIKVTPTEHAEKLLKHWEDYYANKNKEVS